MAQTPVASRPIVRFRLDPEARRALKAYVAMKGTSEQALLEELTLRHLDTTEAVRRLGYRPRRARKEQP